MKTFSQFNQDVFVYNFFEKKAGFFLDFGCGDGLSTPCGNNTFLLETNGWDGISFDWDIQLINRFRSFRKTRALPINLLQINLNELLYAVGCPKIVDYFSFDIDDATEEVIKKFPFKDYQFKLVHFEHNMYSDKNSKLKNLAKEIFLGNGYELLVEDMSIEEGAPLEDWYTKPELTQEQTKIFLKDIRHDEILNKYNFNNYE